MLSYYRKLVSEHSRILAFQKGIEAAVRPGDTVCEIGTGLGTFAFMASRAGAAKVYAIEEGSVVELAKKLFLANKKYMGEVEFIKAHSTETHLKEKVDVVIFEDYECQGLIPEQESVLKDARRRFLKSGGTFIPCGMELFWAPLQAENIWQKEISCLEANKEKVSGLDFSLTRDLVSHSRVITRLDADVVLSSPAMLDSIDFAERQELEFSRKLTIEITKPGILHGFGSWAEFIFPGGHRFSLSYEKPVTVFSRAFFPLPEPVSVEPGDCIRMNVSVFKKPFPSHTWSWWGEVVDRCGKNKTKWQSSTLHLAPFQQQDLYLPQALAPDFRPVLNNEGRLRKFILEQIDGQGTVEEIALRLMEKFPDEIPSKGEALTKVARIVKKCCRQ